MKLGLHINDFHWPGGANQIGPTLVKIAQTADASGFDRISVGDHVWQSPYLGGPEREVHSCCATLAYLAAHTGRIKPMVMVTAALYWQPVLLAKIVTTLDVLSGGRVWLGIGVGDDEEEARRSGLPRMCTGSRILRSSLGGHSRRRGPLSLLNRESMRKAQKRQTVSA